MTRHAVPHYTEHRSPQLLTIGEVAAVLRLHHRTVRRLIRDGVIPAVQLGGSGASLRVKSDELERWLYDSSGIR